MSDVTTEAVEFVAYVRAAGLAEDMPSEFQALADAVDDAQAVPNDARLNGLTNTVDCPRCGKCLPLPLSIDIEALGHWLRYFRYEHRRCVKA